MSGELPGKICRREEELLRSPIFQRLTKARWILFSFITWSRHSCNACPLFSKSSQPLVVLTCLAGRWNTASSYFHCLFQVGSVCPETTASYSSRSLQTLFIWSSWWVGGCLWDFTLLEAEIMYFVPCSYVSLLHGWPWFRTLLLNYNLMYQHL